MFCLCLDEEDDDSETCLDSTQLDWIANEVRKSEPKHEPSLDSRLKTPLEKRLNLTSIMSALNLSRSELQALSSFSKGKDAYHPQQSPNSLFQSSDGGGSKIIRYQKPPLSKGKVCP